MASAKIIDFTQSVHVIAEQTRTLRILRFFPQSDLRCSHDGLRVLAKKNGVDPWKLAPGEFLVFANNLQNKLKIYAPGNVLVYLKSPDNHRIDLDIIRLIPRFFNGTEFNYPAALQKLITDKIERIA